ncbi:MAG TPA: ATP-binding cassette domain-containing protein [Acidimicrobiales bacterium]
MAPLVLTDVCLVHAGRTILVPLSWTVAEGERWIVLGPNGSGKTTLIQIAGLYLHPTSGTVQVLGETLGRCDVRTVRRRIGLASTALAAQLRPQLSALDTVMTASYAALEPWWHTYTEADRAAARAALARLGVDAFADRAVGTLSSGEQQRVLLARAFLTDPGLVLLDEPTARLDLGGREAMVAALAELARDPSAPPMVMVTHHVDEIPPGFDHALVLREGRVVAAGPVPETLTSAVLSEAFGLVLQVERRPDGRLTAWAR